VCLSLHQQRGVFETKLTPDLLSSFILTSQPMFLPPVFLLFFSFGWLIFKAESHYVAQDDFQLVIHLLGAEITDVNHHAQLPSYF
jgi:hypothetical protein